MHPNYPYHHNHPSGLVVLNPSFFPRISSVFHRQLELVGLPHRGIGMSGPGILKNIPGFQLLESDALFLFTPSRQPFCGTDAPLAYQGRLTAHLGLVSESMYLGVP